MRSKASLDSSREVAQGCRVSFVNWLYLIPIIIGQNLWYFLAHTNQTGPEWQSCHKGSHTLPIYITSIKKLEPIKLLQHKIWDRNWRNGRSHLEVLTICPITTKWMRPNLKPYHPTSTKVCKFTFQNWSWVPKEADHNTIQYPF